jgi:hypothetical protein
MIVKVETVRLNPAVETFIDVVRRYCAWAESVPGEPHREMITARQLLAELQLSAINLPVTDVLGNHKFQPIVRKKWEAVHNRFSRLPVVGYWDVYDPLEQREKTPLFGTLADDLTDIYRDLKTYLPLFDAGHTSEALWQWRFRFLANWGYHLAGAQRVLHSYFSNDLPQVR